MPLGHNSGNDAGAVGLLPCPFPHEVKRGVFLEIDMDDFGFARGACSDCGCAGPYVTLDSCERVTEAERAEATRLWNTRLTNPAEPSEAMRKILTLVSDAIDCTPPLIDPILALDAISDVADEYLAMTKGGGK